MNYEQYSEPQKDWNDDYAYNKATGPIDAKAPYQVRYDSTTTNGKTVYKKTNEYRADAWDVDINVNGKINFDTPYYDELMEAKIELMEDCDIDCQKRGSQLTLIATLMGAAYGCIGLNALFMFCGAWWFYLRMCSMICTMVACLFQFAILITTGVLMMTKYNNVCMRSLTPTVEGFRWTMADDFYVTFSLWVISFFAMFIFVCCGMCSGYKSNH